MRLVPAHPARTDAARHNAGVDVDVDVVPATGASRPMVTDLSLDDLERDARRVIGEMAYAYYAGGADDERLLAGNVAAWGHWQLHPRVLAGVDSVATGTTVLGSAVASPVAIAPTAIQGLAHPEGEVATARGAAAAPDAVRWMQVYILRERRRTEELVTRAASSGYRALVLTVDAPVSGLRLREWRTGVRLPDDLALPNLAGDSTSSARAGGFMAVVTREFEPALTPDDIGWLAGLSDLPVVVKGVQRADDAVGCVDAGAAAIVVSNHGARQLADAPATADILAEVVDEVAGRVEVYVDGGIRRSPDVVKALALGARATLVGRPSLWAVATGGADGVEGLLRWFEAELRRALALCGAGSVDQVDRGLVRRTPGWDLV